MSKLSTALVLCDVPAHGLKAGQLVEAQASVIKSLAEAGSVDPHKDAVAAARDRKAKQVRSSIELAAEQREADIAALRVEIAKLEDLKTKATDEPTQAALAQQITQQQAALAALLG